MDVKQTIGVLLGIGKDMVVKRYEENQGIKEKLHDLELLVLKIRSTIELAEVAGVEISSRPSLDAWKSKLEETAKEGEHVLFELNEQAAGSSNSTSSSYSSSPWNIKKRIKRWILGDEDVKRLNETITMLQRASADTKEFREVLKWMRRPPPTFMPFERENRLAARNSGVVVRNFSFEREKRLGATNSRLMRQNSPKTYHYLGAGNSEVMGPNSLWEHSPVCATGNSGVMVRNFLWEHSEGANGCFNAAVTWAKKFISRNQKSRSRVKELLVRLSSAIESQEAQSNGVQWLLIWLAKMREAEVQCRNALKTMKYPWNSNGLDALAERLQTMVADWEGFLQLKKLTYEAIARYEEQPRSEERLKGLSSFNDIIEKNNNRTVITRQEDVAGGSSGGDRILPDYQEENKVYENEIVEIF